MNKKRESKFITIDQVLELVSKLGDEMLVKGWDDDPSNWGQPIQYMHLGTPYYTEQAQQIFNRIYDQIQEEIAQLIQKNLFLTINQIEKIWRDQNKDKKY